MALSLDMPLIAEPGLKLLAVKKKYDICLECPVDTSGLWLRFLATDVGTTFHTQDDA